MSRLFSEDTLRKATEPNMPPIIGRHLGHDHGLNRWVEFTLHADGSFTVVGEGKIDEGKP